MPSWRRATRATRRAAPNRPTSTDRSCEPRASGSIAIGCWHRGGCLCRLFYVDCGGSLLLLGPLPRCVPRECSCLLCEFSMWCGPREPGLGVVLLYRILSRRDKRVVTRISLHSGDADGTGLRAREDAQRALTYTQPPANHDQHGSRRGRHLYAHIASSCSSAHDAGVCAPRQRQRHVSTQSSVGDYCSTLLMPGASGVPTPCAACNCSSTLRNSAALPLP